MKKYKNVKIFMVFLCMLLVSTGICMAAETHMNMLHVDSNTYRKLCSAQKDTNLDYGEVYVENLYTASGGQSDYQAIYVRAGADGGGVTAYKGRWTEVAIPNEYCNIGTYVPLYGKGRDPSLDCKVSGYWNAH